MIRTGFIGGALGYRLLCFAAGRTAGAAYCDGSAYRGRSKVESLLGPGIWDVLAGKVVIDFGCGRGTEAVEIAQRGARRVIGIDIREKVLEQGRMAAEQAGVSDRCVFTTQTNEKADVIISLDGFEHFGDPEQVLCTMRSLLSPTGRIVVSFGPPWFHPFGGHLFSVFPWAHLIFSEETLIRWRSGIRSDGATRFGEVEGGLNEMTVRRFRGLLGTSGLAIEHFRAVPIRRLRFLANPLTREFLTSVVQCTLVPQAAMRIQG